MSKLTTKWGVLVLMAAWCMHSACAESALEQFTVAFDTQHDVIKTVTTGMAKKTWELVCTQGCSYTTPSQNHTRTDDPDIFFSSNFTGNTTQPYIKLIDAIGTLTRGFFIGQLTTDLDNDQLFTNDMFANLLAENFKQLQDMYERFYEGVGESWQTNALMKNAQLEGGAGLGFGVQVQCNDKVVVTIGGGAGTGFAGVYGNMTAGGGGGAGLQAYDTSGTQLFEAGGGGGGGVHMTAQNIFLPSWGTSSDPDQVLDKSIWVTLASEMQECYSSGGLVLRASGGGGGGLLASSPSSGPIMEYGGGWGFSFTHASPFGDGSTSGPSPGRQLGRVATACHEQCAASKSSDYYSCLCPCMKAGFMKVGAAWASHIQCVGTN